MIKRALLSVSDKTGIVELAQKLHQLGVELLSTGGTAKAIKDAGIPVTNVSDVTGFPECLDGRVKTLHPAIHAGLLAMRANPDHMRQIQELGIAPIDMVVINLYPFKATIMKPDVAFQDAIENIDIGGPTMLRAAAKNFQDVVVMVDPADYAPVLAEFEGQGDVSYETKRMLCYKTFAHTAAYDALISNYLRQQVGVGFPDSLTLTYEKVQPLRYGENPHQGAMFYKEPLPAPGTLTQAKQLQGKELSYNNIGDTNGALDLLREFDELAVVAVKHANPCGVAVGGTILDAYTRCYNADPVSIFGGIVVTNAEVDEATAQEMTKIFLEIVVAPSYTEGALKVFKKKKNLRVLQLDGVVPLKDGVWDMKRVAGGMLVQDVDNRLLGEELQVVTERAPSEKEMSDLMLAWRIVKHTKSNGIAVAKDNTSLGVGPGQVNRIWAAEQ
ncbi:MAG: bifunctional phosphoribosylaminoimidazolecarboxamide formyltransferase/IMP cyclohydrolase, partial [Christensenellales bacterium]